MITRLISDSPERPGVQALARRLGLTVVPPSERRMRERSPARRGFTTPTGPALALTLDDRGLALLREDGARIAPAFADGRRASHAREPDLASQPFARALGIAALAARLGREPVLLDATAGLGGDAWLAAALGARVIACEREPVLVALLEDALTRARASRVSRTRELAERITLRSGDAKAFDAPCDIAYLDPMYPERRVRGGQRKDIDALHRIAGQDRDNDELLDALLSRARSHVVVKRPRGAEPLDGNGARSPDDAIAGPNTRYDRYRRAA